MKHIILITFHLIINFSADAQQNKFAKVYDNLGAYTSFSSSFVELNDTSYIVVGGKWLLQGQPGYSFAMRINLYGDTIWTNSYVNHSYFEDVSSVNDSTIALLDGFFFPGESFLNLGLINSNGDSLMHYFYDQGSGGHPMQIKKCWDGGYIMLSDDASDYGIIKLDSAFQVEWHRIVGFNPGCIYPDFIDSTYMVGGYSFDQVKKYSILKMDQYGNDIWYRMHGNMPPSFDAYHVRDIVCAPDSNYIIGSDGNDWQLMKINRDSGDTLWTKQYYNSANGLIYFNDVTDIVPYWSNTFLCASTWTWWSGYCLIDGNNGDTIWRKNQLPLIEKCHSFKKTLDGGFAYCGASSSGSLSHIVFVKCDSLGNTIFTSIVDNETGQLLKIYPNPVTDYLYFSYNVNVGNQNFILYNLQGKAEIETEINTSNFNNSINISHLPNGLYIAELRNAKGDKVVRQKLVVQH